MGCRSVRKAAATSSSLRGKGRDSAQRVFAANRKKEGDSGDK